MFKRILTALLLIPPVVYLIGWSPKWLFLTAVVAAVVLALREYFALCRAMDFRVYSCLGYVLAVALCVAQAFPRGGPFVVNLLVLASFLLVATWALRPDTQLKDYLAVVSGTNFGILYIGLTLSCLIPLRFAAYSQIGVSVSCKNVIPVLGPGAYFALFLFLVIWAGDICAYAIGRPLGRTPFFARISPRKTWEGASAGLAGSVLAAWAFGHWVWEWKPYGSSGIVILLAIWVALAGQAGDLVESAIKRGANQKDSGTLLPGHGGFLDRIDSLLFAAPALLLAIGVLGYIQ